MPLAVALDRVEMRAAGRAWAEGAAALSPGLGCHCRTGLMLWLLHHSGGQPAPLCSLDLHQPHQYASLPKEKSITNIEFSTLKARICPSQLEQKQTLTFEPPPARDCLRFP